MSGMAFDKTGDPALDAAFDAARTARPEPSARLMAAILADAAAQPKAAPAVVAPARARRGGVWAGLWRGLGGWPAAGVLSAALVLGIALGGQQTVPLSPIDALTGGIEIAATDDTGGELMPGIDAFLTEG